MSADRKPRPRSGPPSPKAVARYRAAGETLSVVLRDPEAREGLARAVAVYGDKTAAITALCKAFRG